MKNYKVRFPEAYRDRALALVSQSNDIVVNQVEPEAIFFTIQLEDDEADSLYELISQRINEMLAGSPVVSSDTEEIRSDVYTNRSELR